MPFSRLSAANPDSALVLSLINQARRATGLCPLAPNANLMAAAQAHADDMARSGTGIGHAGSDGSTVAQRILSAGYGVYGQGPIVGENWAAYTTIQVSFGFWMSDAPHRDNILRTTYREIGIGVSRDSLGNPILVTDFGAQPSVIPVYVSSSGETTRLTLCNEDAVPGGAGPSVIGRAVQVDISATQDFATSQTFPWARTLDLGASSVGTLYVRFRDAQGRTAIMPASTGGAAEAPVAKAIAPTGTLTSTATPKPTRTRTRTPRPSVTRTRTTMPTLTRTATATATASSTSTPSATSTPSETLRVRMAMATTVPAADNRAPPSPDDTALPKVLFAAAGAAGLLALVTAARPRRRRR